MDNEHVAEALQPALAQVDPLMASVLHAQRIAAKVGAANMAVEVYGWAIRYARILPAEALKELMDIVAKEPK